MRQTPTLDSILVISICVATAMLAMGVIHAYFTGVI